MSTTVLTYTYRMWPTETLSKSPPKRQPTNSTSSMKFSLKQMYYVSIRMHHTQFTVEGHECRNCIKVIYSFPGKDDASSVSQRNFLLVCLIKVHNTTHKCKIFNIALNR